MVDFSSTMLILLSLSLQLKHVAIVTITVSLVTEKETWFNGDDKEANGKYFNEETIWYTCSQRKVRMLLILIAKTS